MWNSELILSWNNIEKRLIHLYITRKLNKLTTKITNK
jgi:hypothetical protein